MAMTEIEGRAQLAELGFSADGALHWNPTTSVLYNHALVRAEGQLAEGGPLAVDTGVHTGRSPKDKFVVREPSSEDRIWWGDVNQELGEDSYEGLRGKLIAHLDAQASLYVVDAFAGADPAHRITVRVITDHPYHALFAKTMFIEPTEEELDAFEPDALDAARAGSRGRAGRGRNPQRDLRRPAPGPHRGADRRDVLCGRDRRSRSSR